MEDLARQICTVYFLQCLITQSARSPTWPIPVRSLVSAYGRGVANLRYSWAGLSANLTNIGDTASRSLSTRHGLPGLYFMIVLVTESYAPDSFSQQHIWRALRPNQPVVLRLLGLHLPARPMSYRRRCACRDT